MMTPSAKAKLLNRIVEMHNDLQDLADKHEGELGYESACFRDAVQALDDAIKRLRGQSTLS